MKRLILILGAFSACFANVDYSTDEIRRVFEEFVQVNYHKEYYNRYRTVSNTRETDLWPWEGKDFARVIAVLEFEKYIKEQDLSFKKTLSFSNIDPEMLFFHSDEVIECQYADDTINHDLYNFNTEEEDFDFVLLNQTLEHVYDPIRCLKNIYNKMESGGIIYVNVPVCSKPHSTPVHFFTGYTPMGLAMTLKIAGFDLLNVGQWGNGNYLTYMFKTNKWPDKRRMGGYGYNEITCPVITWAFARKP